MKLERTLVYIVNGVDYHSRPAAKMAQARIDMANLLSDAEWNGATLVTDAVTEPLTNWLFDHAKVVRELLNTKFKVEGTASE